MERISDIAVIGASAAGVAAAISLRNNGFDGAITVYDEDPNLPYERPPLSKSLATADRALTPIVAAATYADLGIDLRLGTRVEGLSDGAVRLGGGTRAAHDRILLTTGVSPRRLLVPGHELAGIYYLRNAYDATSITEQLLLGGPLVIIGGGFIGLELAAVARGLDIEVTVIELTAKPLLNAVGPQLGDLITDLHVDHGVRFVTSSTVREFRGAGGALEQVVLDSGQTFDARTVVAGVGVTANDQLAADYGIACTDGILVDTFGASSDPWLWAAGDVAVRNHRHLRRRCRIEHWDTARRHGEAVAASMLGKPIEEAEVPYVWSDQYDLTYQCFGRREPDDRIIVRDGASSERFLAFCVNDGRVHSVIGLGSPREMRAGKVLIERATVVTEDALRDPGTDLKSLAKTGTAVSRR